jgi:hypothetical protein
LHSSESARSQAFDFHLQRDAFAGRDRARQKCGADLALDELSRVPTDVVRQPIGHDEGLRGGAPGGTCGGCRTSGPCERPGVVTVTGTISRWPGHTPRMVGEL